LATIEPYQRIAESQVSEKPEVTAPRTLLVGAGVVGQAILRAHLDAEVPVCLIDQDESRLQDAIEAAQLPDGRWSIRRAQPLGDRIPMVHFSHPGPLEGEPSYNVVIESISERIEVKQSLFADLEGWLNADALLCTNTSTLQITKLAASLQHPQRFCGMHFFMPVYNRPAVEIARGKQTSEKAIDRCANHVRRLRKEPLVVRDGPGFIVNRLLTPYLNEAMLLLCRGVSAERIERAALRYGMPMSPLELIDWIGTRTMFDAGRVFWQSFPSRIRPAAMLAALVKSKRYGRACGAGLYDYDDSGRSKTIASSVTSMVDRYRRDEVDMSDDDVRNVLAIPMWIEAAIACRDGVVQSSDELDLAMRGGLGYAPERSWLEFFDRLGSAAILSSIQRWSELTPAIAAPPGLVDQLGKLPPRRALEAFAREED
jgi:3-hydroxyacyl-CoA dehydrogenase